MPLSATQSRMRARSSSSSRKRRRTGSRSARSSTSEAVRRRPARSISWATTPSTGLVWRSERSARRTRRSVGRSSSGSGSNSSSMTSPAPKVAWISGANASMSGHMTITSRGCSVSSSSSRWRIASRSTSTWRARPWQEWIWMLRSAGSSARGCGRRSARTSAWMRASRRVAAGLDRVVVGDVLVRAEHELHLARVLTPGGEQPVVGERGGGVVGAADDRLALADLVPQRGRGVEEEDVDLAPGGERAQDVEVAGGQPGQPEEREALGQAGERGVGSQPLACGLEPLGGARLRRAARAAGATAPPARRPRPAGRPRRAPTRRPSTAGAARSGRTARRGAGRSRSGARGGRRRPRGRGGSRGCAATARAGTRRRRRATARRRAAGDHGSVSGSTPERGRDGVADEPVRERELDVRAHAVGAPGRRPEARGQPLRQPALHPSGRAPR